VLPAVTDSPAAARADEPPPSVVVPQGHIAPVAPLREQDDWQGVKLAIRRDPAQRWRRHLWSLIFPPKSLSHRLLPTIPGVLLLLAAAGIGVAAYNTAQNTLFITLSLMISCLVLNGVISWLNIRQLGWRLQVATPWRAGQDQVVGLEMRNEKRHIATYGLSFDLRAEPSGARTRLVLRQRLDPRSQLRLEWVLRPTRRGRERIELVSIGSLFPFGFLNKTIGSGMTREVIVWPAPADYRRHAIGGAWRALPGERSRHSGQSGEVVGVRKYIAGDSHRIVHWKATARLRGVMVKQFSSEGSEGVTLWLQTPAETWPRSAQFEVLVSLAATLAEDLFRNGRLLAAAVNDEAPLPIRKLRDLELFLDRLAVVEPVPSAAAAGSDAASRRRNLLTFQPEGPRGVGAFIDGIKAASA
jgi:uncharacterized protein (DUF58 family)